MQRALDCNGRSTDYGHPERAFFQNFWTFWLGQTFWAEIFWGIWGIFGQNISTHFGTVSFLSMFSITQLLFLQKTKPLYPTPKYLFGSGIWIQAAKNLRFSLRVSVVRGQKWKAKKRSDSFPQWDRNLFKIAFFIELTSKQSNFLSNSRFKNVSIIS